MKGTTVVEIFFKLLFQKILIFTISTEYHLIENLTNLDPYISTVNSNINTFNKHLKVNVEVLKERVKRTDNIMTKLFKAYNFNLDPEFARYIKTKKDGYDKREEITSKKFMAAAMNK